MKSSTDGAKTYIDVLKRKLPTEAPSDYSAGAFCLKLSPQWAGIVIGLVDHLLIKGVWENKTPAQWQQIRRWTEELPSLLEVCEEPEPCEECPECPEPEPPTPPIIGGGGDIAVSSILGLSLEELEDWIMGFTLRGQLEFVNGVLCYWGGDCCGWIPIGSSGTGEVAQPITQSALNALASGVMTLEQWVAAGSPPLPVIDVGSHHNPAYATVDSIKCAKATALVKAMRDQTHDVWQALLAAGAAGTATTLGVVGVLLGIVTLPVAALIVTASIVVGTIAAFGFGTTMSSLEELYDDSEAWDDMVCSMTPEMDTGTVVTGTDVATLFYWLRDAHAITLDDWRYKLLHSLSITFWQEKAQVLVPDIDCDCNQYLPSGYTPPIGDGLTFAFDQLAYTGNLAYGSGAPWNGQPFTGAFASGRTGQMVGGKPRTVFTGTESTWSNSNYAAIFKLSDPAEISKMAFDWTFTNGEQNVRIFPYYFNMSTNLWTTYANDQSDAAAPYPTSFEFVSGSPPTFEYFALIHKTRWATSGGVQSYAQLADVRLSGIYGGNGFIDLSLGVVFNP